jgi:acetyltransferase-like isoleucine patch superfamily enzyme
VTRVVLVRTQRKIHPFGCTVDDCGLGGGTFASYRAETLEALKLPAPIDAPGLETPLDGPALVMSDDVWISKRALKAFMDGATAQGSSVRACLPKSRLTDLMLPLQDVTVHDGFSAYDVGYIPAGQKASPKELFSLGEDRWLTIPMKERVLPVPLPKYILGSDTGVLGWPLTSTVVMRVRHWIHVLRAGHVIPQVMLLEYATSSPIGSALRALMSLRLSRASTLRAARANFTYIGRGSFVHPTATVEASVIGDNVTIGAYSYVQNSVIGDGCVVEQRAHVSGCALGPKTFVSLNSSLSACVTFGDTDACINGVQACVIAQKCALTSFARPLDLAPSGQVRVEDEGKLRPVGELPCGVAFGPGVFVGADVVIAAGRAVPPGVRLYVNASSVLQKIDPKLPAGMYAVVDGKPLE